jgi:hypothetical protein
MDKKRKERDFLSVCFKQTLWFLLQRTINVSRYLITSYNALAFFYVECATNVFGDEKKRRLRTYTTLFLCSTPTLFLTVCTWLIHRAWED